MDRGNLPFYILLHLDDYGRDTPMLARLQEPTQYVKRTRGGRPSFRP